MNSNPVCEILRIKIKFVAKKKQQIIANKRNDVTD